MAEGKHSNTAGVRKYFFFIKENVSSDWKDLAFHLDFRRSDTDNISGRNRDDKSRCMDLLEEWLKCNGERATVEVLMEALSQSNLQSTVDGLKNKYPELETPQASSSPESSQQEMKELFQKSAQKYYELKLTYFKPLIWNDNFTVTLSDIFTQLVLIPLQEEQLINMFERYLYQGQGTKLSSLDDLLEPGITGLSTAPRCILIEGEAGGGKTTFLSKAALDAVSQKTELGKRHDIVLLIRLREVWEGETIEEMVWDQCVPETTVGIDVESIRAILQRNESRVLFLLDGFDELRPEARADRQAIPKLLDGKLYPNSTIVITSRPSAGVQQYTRPDCHLYILGFSIEQVVQYIEQYFRIAKKPERGEHLIKHHVSIESLFNLPKELVTIHSKRRIMNDLIHTPIFLLLVCVLWEEDQEMVSTGTITGLYDSLLTCLVRKYCKREGVHMPTDGLPAEVADALLQFGKLALEALQKNETLVDLSEVERENVNWELLLKLGVVSLEVSASKLHPRKQLNFSHRTMQEFLAGRYVAHALVNQDVAELLQLTSIRQACELPQLRNLLRFTSGFNSQAAVAVFTGLGNLRSKVFPHVHTGQFKTRVKFDAESSEKTYQAFTWLCLDLLDERTEPDVLRAVSSALPAIFIDIDGRHKPHDSLMHHLDNILSSHQVKVKVFVRIYGVPRYLERIFVSSLLDPRLELRLMIASFHSPDETTRLVSVLKNVPGLRALDLSLTLTPSSLQQVMQGFSHMSQLEELDLSGCPLLGDAGMDVLKTGMSTIPQLAVLRLGNSRQIIGVCMSAEGMASMAPFLRHLAGLRELDIAHNIIGDTGLKSLTDVLPVFTALQVLGLSGTLISHTGMRTLVPALCKLSRMVELDISCNTRIGDPGLECLADTLPHLTGMKVLKLSEIGITDRGVSALVKALPHLVELQVLDARFNGIGESGVVSLVQTLCQPVDEARNAAPHRSSTLQELHIGGNKGLTEAVLLNVTQLISTLPALTCLDISGHWDTPANLSDTAAMALAQALPRLPALECLNLYNISMEPAGFEAFMQAAEEHPTLDELLYKRKMVPEEADTSASCLVLEY